MLDRGFLKLNKPRYFAEFSKLGSGYLWLNEMEWNEFPCKNLPDEALKEFVPFAFDGGGHFWCWHSKLQNTNSSPIYRCYLDDDQAEEYAPSFKIAVFFQILDYLRDVDREYLQTAFSFVTRYSADLKGVLDPVVIAWLSKIAIEDLPLSDELYTEGRWTAEPNYIAGSEVRWMELMD